ncbi:hypothetical protein CR194_10580 [Salipaludibacillus keqinensis]|uniref:Uncharacterized protein n=1 Tax=Salipaludibacillus keqinensis TaxID=2045207 RepID=A0A323TFD3_9BACI|nr:hypothetical protein [Salipaludibacillus keqinensis]PYZ93599.1 hypothetical protein CR194_10580 [Salipaludibacillus keqinensis]
MERLLKWIGIGIFLGWSVAILVNYSIYQHATTQLTFIHPIVDGILFMGLMFGLYLMIWKSHKKKTSTATMQLGVLGVLSMVLAVIF